MVLTVPWGEHWFSPRGKTNTFLGHSHHKTRRHAEIVQSPFGPEGQARAAGQAVAHLACHVAFVVWVGPGGLTKATGNAT